MAVVVQMVVGFCLWLFTSRMVLGRRRLFALCLACSLCGSVALGATARVRAEVGSIVAEGSGGPNVLWLGQAPFLSPGANYGVGTVCNTLNFSVRNFGEYWQGSFIQGQSGSRLVRTTTVRMYYDGFDRSNARVEVFIEGESQGSCYIDTFDGVLWSFSSAEGPPSNSASNLFRASGTTISPLVGVSSGFGVAFDFADFDEIGSGESTTQPTTGPSPTTQESEGKWLEDLGRRVGADILDEAENLPGAHNLSGVPGSIFGESMDGLTFEAAATWEEAAEALEDAIDSFYPGLTGTASEHEVAALVEAGMGFEKPGAWLIHGCEAYGMALDEFAAIFEWTALLGDIIVSIGAFKFCAVSVAWGLGMRDPAGVLPPIGVVPGA